MNYKIIIIFSVTYLFGFLIGYFHEKFTSKNYIAWRSGRRSGKTANCTTCTSALPILPENEVYDRGSDFHDFGEQKTEEIDPTELVLPPVSQPDQRINRDAHGRFKKLGEPTHTLEGDNGSVWNYYDQSGILKFSKSKPVRRNAKPNRRKNRNTTSRSRTVSPSPIVRRISKTKSKAKRNIQKI